MAVMRWPPSVLEAVFQEVLYMFGDEVAVTSEPRFTPSIWNWTVPVGPAPTLGVTVAVRMTG
jgi:hypothetical protein